MRTFWIWSLGLLVLAGVGGQAFSQGFGIEVHGLYAFNFNGDTRGSLDLEADPEDSFGGGAALIFGLTPYLKIDLGVDYLKAEIKDSGSADIELFPVTISLRAGPTFEPVFLYAGLGIGYSYNDFSGSELGKWTTLKDCPVYFASLGAEVGITECLVVRPELRYTWIKPELQLDNLDPFHPSETVKLDWKLDHLQFRLGLGVYF